MDKTGTLTANRLRFHALQPLAGMDEETMRLRLGEFARSATVTNHTSEALANALPGDKQTPIDEIPFASARKWSALAFDTNIRRGVYVLGAVEMLSPFLPPEAVAPGSPLSRQITMLWFNQFFIVSTQLLNNNSIQSLPGQDFSCRGAL